MRLLDLFCCEGGAAKGYADAGFEVVGVDIEPQPRYPYEFVQADALTFPLDGFDALHASPPCPDHSIANNIHSVDHGTGPYLRAMLDRLAATRLPWVVENVSGARMAAALTLCGTSFGLGLHRHRRFETSFSCLAPPCNPSAVRYHGRDKDVFGHHANTIRIREEWGVPWMSRDGIAQCIPPAYTEWIGAELMAHLSEVVA